MKRRGENCSNFQILHGMMNRFNSSMYDRKRPQIVAPLVGPEPRAEANDEDDDHELVQVLNDVEEMFGQPVSFT